jgi:hypothetical protein
MSSPSSAGKLVRRLGRGRVAVEGALPVGAGGGGGGVGVQGDVPALAVDGDEVVEAAEQGEVGEGVPAAVFAVDEVVDVAAGGARERAR